MNYDAVKLYKSIDFLEAVEVLVDIINTRSKDMICKQSFQLKKDGKPRKCCICRNPELIENYELAIADTAQTWEVHHRREEFYSQQELIEGEEYFDRPPEELIFLTKSEHGGIDSKCKRVAIARKGKHPSEETKRKLSEAKKGENNPLYGKHHSEEHKRKLSLVCKEKKKVLCIETGVVYESVTEAAKLTNSHYTNIVSVCRGRLKKTNGYHWRYV